MADVAFSKVDDLLFGSGELYVSIDGDGVEWRHLGNVDEFVITTTTEDVEKYGSMNSKRELQSTATSQISITASALLTEYNRLNIAMALYGDFGEVRQQSLAYTDEIVKLDEIPNTITVRDPDGNRCFGILNVTMKPKDSLYPDVYWVDDRDLGEISEFAHYKDTFTFNDMGGIMRIDMNSAVITKQFPIYVNILEAPKYTGDLLGMRVRIYDGSDNSVEDKVFESSLTQTVVLNSGISVTFVVDNYHTFSVTSSVSENGIKALAIPNLTEYEEGIDFIVDKQSSRAGLIKIPEFSRIKAGEEFYASCVVPEKQLHIVYGGSRKDISGKLLYVPDNIAGPNYVIEAWKVKIKPEGDLSGLISDGDFGSFKIDFKFLADYENHPESPYFSTTLVDYPNNFLNSGKYDSSY